MNIQKTTLIEIKNDIAFADSLQIADHFGKRHNDTINIIEKLMRSDKKINENLVLSFYIDSMNRKKKRYLLNRDAFTFVVQKFQGKKAHEWQWKYIEAFKKMNLIASIMILPHDKYLPSPTNQQNVIEHKEVA